MTHNNKELDLNESELGKKSLYDPIYNSEKLFQIQRMKQRNEFGITSNTLPFFGFDCWNHYEVSWLNEKGKPVVGMAEIVYDCESPYIIESKSMKLYFNSFNNTKYPNKEVLAAVIKEDLEKKVGSKVLVNISTIDDIKDDVIYRDFDGFCIDYLDIQCSSYSVDPTLLTTQPEYVEEKIFSNLLKSNCLVTNQPDFGSIQISYKGNKINYEGLLQYIVSFRNHNEFHEQCIERIFMDVMKYCKPAELTVYGRYTRRGGLDINPFRSTSKIEFNHGLNKRLCRQ
jgi:7-cyano-7-deazaguanine reductase